MPNRLGTRKYDCEFTAEGCISVAADICALYPTGSSPKAHAVRATSDSRLMSCLQQLGVGGILIDPPPPRRSHANGKWHQWVARRIRDQLQSSDFSQTSHRFEVDGCTIQPYGSPTDPITCRHFAFSCADPTRSAGEALAALLQKKNDQLDVCDRDRILILTNAGTMTTAAELTRAAAFIDFSIYTNIDRIFFEECTSDFHLIYSAKAWKSLYAPKLPDDQQERDLVTKWLTARLSGNYEHAFESVVELCCELHSTDWLTESAKTALEMEIPIFLHNSMWDAPRRLWSYFCGPLPAIRDARRKQGEITAPRIAPQ